MKNRKRNRMQGFDYSSDNLYFVTICVQDRKCCLGMIGTSLDQSVPKMELNEFGKIVKDRIGWLTDQYKYVDVHNYVIMPNHVHAIIEIDKRKLAVGTGRDLSVHPLKFDLSVHPLKCDLSVGDKEIKIKSLSSLMGAFKTTSSKMIHQAGFADFAWQRSFHDHIIRNEKSYQNISNYIDLNPEKWVGDTFFEDY